MSIMDIPTFHPDEYNCAKEYDYEGDRIATWAYPTVMDTTFRPSTPPTEAVEEAEAAHEEAVAESYYTQTDFTIQVTGVISSDNWSQFGFSQDW